jgi:hypothetical protein
MKVITTESLERLRVAVTKTPTLVERDFFDLTEEMNLKFIEFNSPIQVNRNLISPEGFTQETNKDTDNCQIILSILEGLTPAQATDERLWVQLCFDQFAEYANHRWPLSRATTEKNHVNDHWFAKTNRNRMRDNAISRLWWMGQIAQRVPNYSMDQVLEVLFFNSDYRSSLLERTSSTNSLNVLATIIKISKDAFDSGYEFDREKFRLFMKKVDFLGKKTLMGSLGIKELSKILKPMYFESYGLK